VQDAASLSSACLSAEASGASPRKRLNGQLCSRPLQPALQPALLSPRKLVSPDLLPIWRVIAQAGQKLCTGRCPSGLSFRRLPVKRLLICRGKYVYECVCLCVCVCVCSGVCICVFETASTPACTGTGLSSLSPRPN